MPSTSVIRQVLDFEGPRTSPVDPMDIIQDAPNRSGARSNTAIGGDTEQAMAQNPPCSTTEIRKVGTEAIRLVQHLTGMVERSDALNQHNQYELNILQQKVDERYQLIV